MVPEHLSHQVREAVQRRDRKALIYLAHEARGSDADEVAAELIRLHAWDENYHQCSAAVYASLAAGSDRSVALRALEALDEIPDAAGTTLEIFAYHLGASPNRAAALERFLSWFVRIATPNQIGVAVAALTSLWPEVERGEIRECYAPLVRWAVSHGQGVLGDVSGNYISPMPQSRPDSQIALRVIVAFAHARETDLLVPAVAMLLSSDGLDTTPKSASSHDGSFDPSDRLWGPLERALQLGAQSEWIWAALSRSAALRDILRVDHLVVSPATPDHALFERALEAYPALCESVRQWLERQGQAVRRPNRFQPLLARVGQAIDAGEIDDALLHELEGLVARHEVLPLLQGVLSRVSPERLAHGGIEELDYRALLESGSPPALLLALWLLVRPSMCSPRSLEPTERAQLEGIFEALVACHPAEAWPEGLHGSRVRIESPTNRAQFAVCFEEGVWRSSSEQMFARLISQQGERGRMLCALWFAHEMLHHAQGVAKKNDITSVRAGGHESLVLALDLEADMRAISWVARLGRAGWTTQALHEVTILGFESFPATIHHTAVSVERKSLRIACHLLIRILEPAENNWITLQLPIHEGEASVWSARPMQRRLGSVRVTHSDVRMLRQLARSPDLPVAMREAEERLRVLWHARESIS